MINLIVLIKLQTQRYLDFLDHGKTLCNFYSIFIFYGCANISIIPARPYIDIEPSEVITPAEDKYTDIWSRINSENNFSFDPLPNETSKYKKRFLKKQNTSMN